ncbi:uncharacterized protein CTRU02_207757 [Colletotrichum truncatum]|uniref:Uncharacterized protein n=1 Tax=Colletotrichum truncatum TaxID=5467 RepID=A0ACC3Z1R8_COLTU
MLNQAMTLLPLDMAITNHTKLALVARSGLPSGPGLLPTLRLLRPRTPQLSHQCHHLLLLLLQLPRITMSDNNGEVSQQDHQLALTMQAKVGSDIVGSLKAGKRFRMQMNRFMVLSSVVLRSKAFDRELSLGYHRRKIQTA